MASDKVDGVALRGDVTAFLEAAHQLVDQGVSGLVEDETCDVLVRDHAECAEDDDDGEVLFHVVHAHAHIVAELGGFGAELERRHLGHAELVVLDGSDLGHVRILGVFVIEEHVGLVLGDAILTDHDLLVAVHDKVAAVVVLALLARVHEEPGIVEHAILALDHDRNLSEEHVGHLFRFLRPCMGFLPCTFWSRARALPSVGPFTQDRGAHVDVHIEIGGVGKVAVPRVEGRHDLGASVFFHDGRL